MRRSYASSQKSLGSVRTGRLAERSRDGWELTNLTPSYFTVNTLKIAASGISVATLFRSS